ncbi:MAG: restriction endonuclease subunit S [Aeriscardovia sp.]|nr:restriction endonuclease subunit S [Aeriscardovia sp.]
MTDKLIAGNGKVEFRSFALEELFTASKGDTDLQKKDINGKGQFVVTSGETNQGIEGRTDRPAKIFPSNTITIDFLGNAYYREYEYKMVTHNRVCSLSGNVIRNDKVGIYLVGVLSKLRTLFSYNHAATWDRLKILTIELPVTSTNDIDFAYMQERIAELEKERIAELDAYLAASSLDDYELTDEDKEILSLSPESASDEAGASEADHGNGQVVFKAFKIGSLFDVVKGKRLTKSAMKPGNIPFIGASAVENGVTAHISNEENLHDGNKITVAYNGAVGSTFYQPDPFVASDDVNVLYPRFEMNERNALFIMASIKKTAVYYSYTHKWDKAAMEESDILLPITSFGDLDFDYMERYIRASEKLAIADMAKYKDKLIATTRQVVGA